MIRTNTRVALYARFSSDNQRSESIDAQIRAMETYCKQHRYTIVNTYIDEAKSATTDRRPSFQQMVADSASHIFDVLLVHKLDRFARNRYDSAIYKRELKKNGVTVYSVLENLDSSPESIMMESVLEGMSEYYSQNLAREVMKGMKETALQCKHTGGKPPLGYDIDQHSKKLIINEPEAEWVRLIFTMYADGCGYSSILSALHEQGALTKKGNEFQKNSLHSILSNRKYSGTYVFNRSSPKNIDGTRNSHRSKDAEDIISIDGGCPQIIDAETFAKVQQRMQGHKHIGGRCNAKQSYLLSGVIYCKDCGRSMVGNARRSGRDKSLLVTYRCPSPKHICNNKEINKVYLESYVVHLMEEELFSKSAMRTIAKNIRTAQDHNRRGIGRELQQLSEQLSKVMSELTNIADAIAQGLIFSALTDRLCALEEEKLLLEGRLAKASMFSSTDELHIDPTLIPSQYAELCLSPTSPSFKEFLCSFISRIEVGRYTVNITLKTGLDILPALDKTFFVRRQEIYEVKKTV